MTSKRKLGFIFFSRLHRITASMSRIIILFVLQILQEWKCTNSNGHRMKKNNALYQCFYTQSKVLICNSQLKRRWLLQDKLLHLTQMGTSKIFIKTSSKSAEVDFEILTQVIWLENQYAYKINHNLYKRGQDSLNYIYKILQPPQIRKQTDRSIYRGTLSEFIFDFMVQFTLIILNILNNQLLSSCEPQSLMV